MRTVALFQNNIQVATYINSTMEIITTKRGGQKLCLDGFMYTCKHAIWKD